MPVSTTPAGAGRGFAPSSAELDRLCGLSFERARFPMAVLAGDLRVVRGNARLAELVDASLAELSGRRLEELLRPADLPALWQACTKALREEEVAPVEVRLRGEGGRRRVELGIELVRGAGGAPACYLVQMRDVTDERASAERLRRLLRLHSTLAGAHEAVLRATTVAELFASACEVAVDNGGFRLAWIGTVRREDQVIVPAAARGPSRSYLDRIVVSAGGGPESRGPVGTAVRLGRPEVRDVVADPLMAPWRSAALDAGFASVAAFPLALDGGAAGALAVYASEHNYFDAEVIALLERLVENVSYGWQALEHDLARRRSQAELLEQGRRLRQRFEQTAVPSLTVDLDGRVKEANPALSAVAGRPAAALAGCPLGELLVADEVAGSAAGPAQWLGAGNVTGARSERAARLMREDGSTAAVLVSSTLVRDGAGEAVEIYLQLQDVTHTRAAEELAARRHAQQAALVQLGRVALLDGPLAALYGQAVELVATHVASELAELLELDPARARFERRAATGFRPELLAHEAGPVPAAGTMAARVLAATAPVVVRDHAEADTPAISALLSAHGVRASAAVKVGAAGRDLGILAVHATTPRGFEEDEIAFLEGVAHVLGAAAARRESAEELARRALYDELTGLPNRSLLLQRLDTALAGRAANGEVAVLFVDLDRFKLVNDSLGHGAGDELLRACSERVVACVAEAGLVARFGGDELVVVCGGLVRPAEAVELAGRLLAVLAVPIAVAGHELSASASVGIALAAPKDTPSDLLRNADIAMYRAKATGGSCAVVFDAAMRASLEDRLQLEADLRRALERDELVVHYQPVVDLATGQLVGAEALVRWHHPARGVVEPAAFVPLAEETGLVMAVGSRVLSLVCADLARWRAETVAQTFVVAVNVSARQLRSPAFPASVAETLDQHGVSPSALCLEITESVLLEDGGTTLEVLESLKVLGVRLSVDDFGTGYSSLAYLRRYPIDELKVDRSFVAELGGDETQAAIVTGVVQLARALEVAVVAEGVETALQLGQLRALGCDRVQGFLMSTPVAGDDFERRWLGLAPA